MLPANCWISPAERLASASELGSTAEIVQGKEFTQSKTVEVKRAPKIAAVPSLQLINEPYMTKSSANVRSAPNKNAGKVGGLKTGTEFTAVGSTGDWILVGRKGVTVGYVHKDLVQPSSVALAKNIIKIQIPSICSIKSVYHVDCKPASCET